MKKLSCDICNGALEMNANGQGAVCVSCGMTYSTARLKEKLGIQEPVQQAAEDIVYDIPDSAIEEVYDINDYECIDTSNDFKRFMLIVEDCFLIKGRGMVVTGYVQDASVHLNEQVTLVRTDGTHLRATVGGIERFKQLYDRADPGEAVGILLPEIKPGQVGTGDVLCASPAVGQTVSDFYKTLRCSGCGTPFRIHRAVKETNSRCPNCNTPLRMP